MNKRITIWCLIVVILSAIAAYVYFLLSRPPVLSGPKPLPEPEVQNKELTFVDYASPRELVGDSHNVFVAQITKKIGNQPRNGNPETQFEARVIYNIKGNLSGLVTVREYLNAHGLQPGTTYILATRGGHDNDGYTLNTDGELSSVLSASSSLTDAQLEQLSKDSNRVQDLLVGYVYEIVPDTALRANVAYNNFQSLSSEEENAVLKKIKTLPLAPVSIEAENTNELCSDRIDNDHNHFIDLADPNCAAFLPPAVPEDTKALCSDQVDNDRNGLTDLRDPACGLFVGAENTREFCSDGLDNDLDGYRDLKDPDCSPFSSLYHPPSPPPPPPSVPSSTEELAPPVISNLTNVVASTSITISWTTNKPATSQLLFGSSTAMTANVPADANLTTSHSQRISGLVPGSTYYYEVQSKDASDITVNSAQQSFATPGESVVPPPPAPVSASAATSTAD